jgi:hypothetical protein
MAGIYQRLKRSMKRSVGARDLGLFHQPDDAGDGVILGGLGDGHAQRGLGIDRAGEDRIARTLGDGNAFAGHRAVIHARSALGDLAICRDAVARTDKHHLPDGKA